MKKFLKGVVGYFLGTAMFVYTACIFMEPNSDQKAKIDELKTAKAKATHWNRYLNTLKEYEDQYSMNPDSEYPEVLEQVKGELAKLDLSTSVPPSNP